MSPLGKKRRCKQGINRQPGAAGHKGVHHDGQFSVAVIFQGSGCHDRRHITAESDQHGNERLTRQAYNPHKSVHNKGGPGHVAGIFQKGEEKKHETDGRNKGGHGLDTATDTIGENDLQPDRDAKRGEQSTETIDKNSAGKLIKKINKGPAEIDGKHEHQVHGGKKNRDT